MAAAAAAMLGSSAIAGPPFATDDPEPTELRHWEIYLYGSGTKSGGVLDGAGGIDLSYGLTTEVQLSATLPVNFVRDRGTRAGLGDIEVGVKYRFYRDEASGVSVAIFPRVFLPTAGKRFGTGRAQLLLPVWAQKDFGPWSLFGGGGYTINPGSGNRHFWQSGIALTRTMGPRLSLGGEVTHQSASEKRGRSATALGIGGTYQLGGPFALLMSVGPGFEHGSGTQFVNAYAALGIAF